ncbi:MAG: leucine-rich repeat domain-containing protein [Clostridium sp.]|nr:leucine-rich repeat domain-containing protein [Clostridium sp.]
MFLSQKEIGISDKAVFKSIINTMKNRINEVKITEGIINTKINEEAMDKLDYIRIEGTELRNIDFLKHFKNLKELSIIDVSGLEDIMGLAYLTQLKTLSFESVYLKDLSPIDLCTNIEDLEYCLGEGNETYEDIDFSFLYRLPNLKSLDLSECGIKDISFLSSCVNLEEISLAENPINSTYPLTQLKKLKVIEVENCGLSEIDGIEEFAENECLEKFFACDNNFSADKIDYYKNELSRLEVAEFE